MTANDYKSYKIALRQEFSHACGYCHSREPELGGSEAFHVDHYKPQSKFPHLVCKYTNLIYACRYCNRFKSNYWPRFTEKIQGKYILNPRVDNFKEHLNQSSFAWTGITTKGKWTVFKLRLDSDDLIRRRKDRLSIENAINRLEVILSQSKLGLNIAIQKNAEESELKTLRQDIAEQIEQIDALHRKILGPLD
jgi:hypothetical protein